MPTLQKLYQQAKAAGIPLSEYRGKNAAELQELLDGGKPVVKKKSKAQATPVKKKTRRGRPARKATARKAPVRKAISKPKRTARKASTNGNGGRNTLSRVNYSKTDGKDGGWNPRPGSAPDRIVKALKKFKGDREKVFDFLVDDIWDFMGKVKRNGKRRTKADAEAMLRYRIARTDWQFAIMTDQHEPSGNRVEYGTGGTGEGTWKPAKKTAKKAAAKPKAQTTRKRTTRKPAGRPQKAPKATSDNNVGEMSDRALQRLSASVSGRGRPPARVAAARKELEKRAKAKGRAAAKGRR